MLGVEGEEVVMEVVVVASTELLLEDLPGVLGGFMRRWRRMR